MTRPDTCPLMFLVSITLMKRNCAYPDIASPLAHCPLLHSSHFPVTLIGVGTI